MLHLMKRRQCPIFVFTVQQSGVLHTKGKQVPSPDGVEKETEHGKAA